MGFKGEGVENRVTKREERMVHWQQLYFIQCELFKKFNEI